MAIRSCFSTPFSSLIPLLIKNVSIYCGSVFEAPTIWWAALAAALATRWVWAHVSNGPGFLVAAFAAALVGLAWPGLGFLATAVVAALPL
eukprot:g24920.t1